MFGFLQQKQVQLDLKEWKKKEMTVKLGRFSSSFLVQRVFEVKGHGKAFAGKILRGKIKIGQNVYFSGTWGKLESIEAFKKLLFEANEGESVAIKITGVELPVERGSMLHFK